MAYAAGLDGPTCAVSGGLAAISLRIAFIDLKLRIITHADIIAMTALGLTWVWWNSPEPLNGCASALLHGLGYSTFLQVIRSAFIHLRGREGMGLGDVKLVFAAGPLLSVEAFALAIAASATAGLVFAALRIQCKGRTSSRYIFIPLGSVIAPALSVIWIFSIKTA